MRKILDLKNEKFGRLLVIEQSELKGKNGIKWVCLCDCGNKIIVDSWNLRSGNTKSCGCLQKERVHESKFINIENEKYGRLTVKSLNIIKNGKTFWNCECECGNMVVVDSGNLKNGNTKSCGCYNLELIYERTKKYNKYDLETFDYGVGYTQKDEEFYFDKDDYDLIKNYCWGIDFYGYASAREINGGKLIKLHRLVMGVLNKIEIEIDHDNRKRNDNRKENLRFATRKENSQNRSISSRNKTGIIGVAWRPIINKWSSYISKDYKYFHIGVYINFFDAVYNRLLAEKEFYGEFAPQRHLFKEYGIE